MKRILSLALVVVMLLCFGACDKKNEDNNNDNPANGPIVYKGSDARGWNGELTIDGTQATLVVSANQGGSFSQVNTLTGTVAKDGDVNVITFTSAKVKITVTTDNQTVIDTLRNMGKYWPDDQKALWDQVMSGQEIEITPDQDRIWGGNITYTEMKCTLNSSAKTFTLVE